MLTDFLVGGIMYVYEVHHNNMTTVSEKYFSSSVRKSSQALLILSCSCRTSQVGLRWGLFDSRVRVSRFVCKSWTHHEHSINLYCSGKQLNLFVPGLYNGPAALLSYKIFKANKAVQGITGHLQIGVYHVGVRFSEYDFT